MLFTSLLASRWRWVLAGLAVVLAIAVGAQGLDYASSWLAHCQAVRTSHAAVQAHAGRATAEPAHRHHFDSLLFTRIGAARELARTRAKLHHLDDSLAHRLPAAPALPAEPPRQ